MDNIDKWLKTCVVLNDLKGAVGVRRSFRMSVEADGLAKLGDWLWAFGIDKWTNPVSAGDRSAVEPRWSRLGMGLFCCDRCERGSQAS
ncbi:hypothetical protein [Poriferisphaera corsica]|uniref:hypothetical protein n=1 Tax=Poriferisphaera corsica TaxID=2528020 RepID=UPI0011A553B4|nr:hypothetical protein [Poriferisphaera corsica]